MTLTAYKIVDSSSAVFSFQQSRPIRSLITIIVAVIVALFLFLLLKGMSPSNLVVSLLLLPVIMTIVVLAHGLTPFSVHADTSGIHLTYKWLIKFSRQVDIPRHSVSALVVDIRAAGLFSLFHVAFIEVVTTEEKAVRIFTVARHNRQEVQSEIDFVAGALSTVLSIAISSGKAR